MFQSKNFNRIEWELNKSGDYLKWNLSNKKRIHQNSAQLWIKGVLQTLGQCCHLSPISGGVLHQFFAGFKPNWTALESSCATVEQTKNSFNTNYQVIRYAVLAFLITEDICMTRHGLIARLILLNMIKLPILRYHFIISFGFKEKESEIMLTGINYMVIWWWFCKYFVMAKY